MRGNTVCDTWARVPGLSSYWCLQLQWRMDEDVIAALTEPRYPVPDEDLDTIILTQTIYLLQLFLHLHEFDPCLKDGDPDEDLLSLFQDILGREFNTVYGAHPARIYQGPSPDGEALERVVRGLMLAQKEGSERLSHTQSQPTPQSQSQQQQKRHPPERSRSRSPRPASPQTPSSPDPTKAGLQHLVVQLLAELNRPLYKQKSRYEEAHGPRTDDTWAARLATRVVQWRFHMRNPVIQPALRGQVIRVSEDVHALDDEGLEVYRALRNVAPGFIHVATPLQPEMQLVQPLRTLGAGVGAGSSRAGGEYHQGGSGAHQHQRSASGGMKMQHLLASPIPQTPDHTPTVSSNTPRTPLYPPPPGGGTRDGGGGGGSAAGPYGDGGANKRGSAQNLAYPPAKRPRSAHRYEAAAAAAEQYEGEHRRPKRERQPQPPLLPPPTPVGAPAVGNPAVVAAAGEIPIRGSGGGSGSVGAGDGSTVYRQLGPEEEDTDLLRRILDGVNGLHQRMHGMHRDLGRRFNALENRLQRLEEWITDPV